MIVPLHDGTRVECEAVKSYAWADGAGAEVDKRVRTLRAADTKVSYAEAMRLVLDGDEHLKKTFAAEAGKGRPQPRSPVTFKIGNEAASPGEVVDHLVRRHIAAHPGKKYSEAMDAVLADPTHAELKRAYAMGGGV